MGTSSDADAVASRTGQRPPIVFTIPKLQVSVDPPPRGHRIVCVHCPKGPGTKPPNPALARVFVPSGEFLPLCVDCAPPAIEAVIQETVHQCVKFFGGE